MQTKALQLNEITLDEAVQPRVELDDDHIVNYVEDLQEGAKFPPVVVFYDGSAYWLSDGFHRYQAHLKAGFTEIEAEIHEGGKRDAIMRAVGSNATHGKRRTNADKRKAVETLLKDKEWGAWSDRQIAEACRVSQPFVGKVRKEMTENGYKFPKTRKCSDGRDMNTAQIGSSKAASPDESRVGGQNNDDENPSNEGSTAAGSGQGSEGENPPDSGPEQNPEDETDHTDEGSTAAGSGQGSEDESPPDSDSERNPEDEKDPEESSGSEDETTESLSSEAQEDGSAEGAEDGTEANQGDNDSQDDQPEVDSTDSDETALLKQKVEDLESELSIAKIALHDKDDLIRELEDKVKELESEVTYYKAELMTIRTDFNESEAMRQQMQNSSL